MLMKLSLAALLMSDKAALLPEQKASAVEVQNPVTLAFGCWSRVDRTPVDITAVNRAIDRTDATNNFQGETTHGRTTHPALTLNKPSLIS